MTIKPDFTSRALYTIGYEGSVLADFVATLALRHIELVVDVRDVPISRKPGFSKRALESQLAAAGIDYLHIRSLGDPKAGRIAAREGRFDEFRSIYSQHLTTDAAQLGLDSAIAAATGRSACLLCFERDFSNCHRRMVADAMTRRAGFVVTHLGVKAGLAMTIEKADRALHDRAEQVGFR
ncbi:DUF488 domain-containing protein [Kaistia dalseonensis]|uniref:Uncharacterized protein (DUF488 family) n=1 Tax=Kaistia dalseonensis TaxID=410840 RepID=A0ABU0H8M1_9HYPH|nr:DUF488 domain-containing protein [Kaistia dalseonensis]MCX5495757.1 DUF488 domain-containing protein [Kaistia dalseonensis]MDQ0438357.1 uncharacterized protein (DUF488 family) [Kaistia dalseonensis]